MFRAFGGSGDLRFRVCWFLGVFRFLGFSGLLGLRVLGFLGFRV